MLHFWEYLAVKGDEDSPECFFSLEDWTKRCGFWRAVVVVWNQGAAPGRVNGKETRQTESKLFPFPLPLSHVTWYINVYKTEEWSGSFIFQDEIYTNKCEYLSESYFSATETGDSDFVQKCLGPSATHTYIYIYDFFFNRNRACASLWKIKHALLSCTQGFVPTTHCPTTTAMFHHEQTHRKSFHAPIVCSIHLPWLERKLCSLGVWSNQMQQGLEPALLFSQKTLLAQWVMETWISPSPEVKNTHFTTEPDCVVTFQSLVIFMKQHCTSEAFLVLVYISLPLTLFSIAKKYC